MERRGLIMTPGPVRIGVLWSFRPMVTNCILGAFIFILRPSRLLSALLLRRRSYVRFRWLLLLGVPAPDII